MRRNVAWRWLGVLLLWAGPVVVAGEEPPPLSGPTPATPAADGPPAVSENRPMLVIPGVNAPGRVRARTAPLPPLEPAGTPIAGDAPALFGPSGRVPTSPVTFSVPAPALAAPARPPGALGRPLPLESLPEPAPSVTGPRPAVKPPTSATNPGPTPAPTAPRRTPSRFGRFSFSPFTAGRDTDPQSAITGEPSTDPAAEAALKRRIERQIHDSLGDRVQDVEVRVVGRDVTIRAKATRFWQRRTVRRALESMPGLAGYRPTIEILD